MTDRTEYQREWARRKRRALGASERIRQDHGTPAGYRRHRYHGEPACDACRAAWADYNRVKRGYASGLIAVRHSTPHGVT